MTQPRLLTDPELAEAAGRAQACHERMARANDGFFLSDGRRRSAAEALAAATDELERLAREWVFRSVERLVGAPVTRVEVRRDGACSPPAVVAAVIGRPADEGETPVAPDLIADVAHTGDPELSAALSCLSAAWTAPVPTSRVLTRSRPGANGGTGPVHRHAFAG